MDKGENEKALRLLRKGDFQADRSKEEWPEDWEAANRLWENRLKYDIVNEILSYSAKKRDAEKSAERRGGAKPAEKPAGEKGAEVAGGDSAAAETEAEKVAEVVEEEEEAPKTFEEKLAKAEKEVLRRYERLIENYRKADAMEIQEIYLNTLSRLYDPHSSFLSEYYLEEFDISVRNALVGIGALLQDKDGYCTISELMPRRPRRGVQADKPRRQDSRGGAGDRRNRGRDRHEAAQHGQNDTRQERHEGPAADRAGLESVRA